MQESGENYLETILLLKKRLGNVRSIDIATELNYSKPSISRAVGILKEAGYIEVDEGGYIDLTETGLRKSTEIYERHQVLRRFLHMTTGMDPETADADACRIEHVISSEGFMKVKEYVDKRG